MQHHHSTNRQSGSSAGSSTHHCTGYQGHQHRHQGNVSFPHSNKKRKHGQSHKIYGDASVQYPFGSYNPAAAHSYGGVRGSHHSHIQQPFGGPWGINLAGNRIGNMHVYNTGNHMMINLNKEHILNKPPKLQRGCPKPLCYFDRKKRDHLLFLVHHVIIMGINHHDMLVV